MTGALVIFGCYPGRRGSIFLIATAAAAAIVGVRLVFGVVVFHRRRSRHFGSKGYLSGKFQMSLKT